MEPTRNLTLFLRQSNSIYHVTTEMSGRYTYANELYKKFFFQDTKSFHDQFFQTCLLAGDALLYKSTIDRCIASPGLTISVDLRRFCTDESIFWMRWELCAFSEEGKNDLIEALGTDITERKRAETEKKEVQQRLVRERYLLRTLIDHLPDAIYVKDTESRHIINNKASLLMIGANTEEETIGKTVLDYFNSESASRQMATDKKLLKSGKRIDISEEFIINKKGEKRWLLTTKVPLKKDDDQVIGLVGISRDITESKKMKADLAADLISRQRQVTEATIMGQEKERAEIGRELHDNINQILTTTKMYLDMALTEKDIREELIKKSHENISSAIEEIRILSKSLVPPSLGDIGLKEAVQEMVNNLKFSQKIEILLHTSGLGKHSLSKNAQLMAFRIVQEQMNNVLKYSKATKVDIRISLTMELLILIIADNGIGFDPKKRMKGIGLMNITSRAELHDGAVEIISSPGNGCTLKISIPTKS